MLLAFNASVTAHPVLSQAQPTPTPTPQGYQSITVQKALCSSVNPNTLRAMAMTTIGIAAAAKVLEATASAGTVQLTGLGTPNSMRPYVRDGTVAEFALWNIEDLGYLASTWRPS